MRDAGQSTRITPVPAASDQELFDIIAQHRLDCIVLDYDFGGYNGLTVKNEIERRYADPPPIVMLTGDGRESTVIKAFRMGVHDYVPKHKLQQKTLISAVTKAVEDDRSKKQKEKDYKRLVASAPIDLISGLFGRSYLDDCLRQLAALPRDRRRSYATIVIELANYQAIVQSIGMKEGDAAIRAFAKRLNEGARSEDICGRYEHGTFLVVADVKGDPGVLRGVCERFAANQTMMIQLNAATLVLEATVAGALCDAEDADLGRNPGGLLEPVLKMAIDGKADGRSCSLAQSSVASSDAEKAPISSPTLPAAEQLRTGNRRSEPRHRVFRRGVVHLLGTQSTFNCTVRNLSGNGAGLRLDTAFAVPETFDLEIIGSGVRRRSALQWQSGVDFGVSFRAS